MIKEILLPKEVAELDVLIVGNKVEWVPILKLFERMGCKWEALERGYRIWIGKVDLIQKKV